MKTSNIKLALLVLFFLSSCTVVEKTQTVKTMDIFGAGVIQNPVVVDLDVKETKVTGTATSNTEVSIEKLKHDAVANALKNSNADVLVDPRFETEINGNQRTATVTGYPATYKNFRSAKPEDVELLKVGSLQKADVYQVSKLSTTAKSTSDYGFRSNCFIANYETGLTNFKNEELTMFSVMLSNGYQLNPYFSMGLGTGVELSGNGIKNFPIYIDTRTYFSKSRIAPYFNLGIGYNLMNESKSNYYSSKSNYYHGFMINPALGIRFAINKKIGVGTNFGFKYINTNSLAGISLRFNVIF